MSLLRIQKTKSRRSSKPAESWAERIERLAQSISISDNIAMVSCTACVKAGVTCYYDRERSVKCAECLRHQRGCDGTFALEEFRKVGEQKKLIEAQAREKRRAIAKLRKALADLEAEDVDLQDDLARLNDVSSRMLRREMTALGVMDSLDTEQEVALGDPGFDWVAQDLVVEQIDWDVVLSSDTLQQAVG
jgi:hypothetical protein